jgi:hypothetical protein
MPFKGIMWSMALRRTVKLDYAQSLTLNFEYTGSNQILEFIFIYMFVVLK